MKFIIVNFCTRKEMRQLVKEHGYIEVYDSKDDHIRARIYIDSKGKLKMKLPDGTDIDIKFKK